MDPDHKRHQGCILSVSCHAWPRLTRMNMRLSKASARLSSVSTATGCLWLCLRPNLKGSTPPGHCSPSQISPAPQGWCACVENPRICASPADVRQSHAWVYSLNLIPLPQAASKALPLAPLVFQSSFHSQQNDLLHSGYNYPLKKLNLLILPLRD